MDSDDELTLSSHALAALAQFRQEEEQHQEQFNALYEESDKKFHQKVSIDMFKEDWQLSQFWYTDETSRILGQALLEGADENTVVVIASAPAVYAAIKNLEPEQVPTKHIYLLEFDTRFEVLAGKDHFFKYDYNSPDEIPEVLRHKCHRLLIDPPFLEPECQTKSAQAAHNMLVADKTARTSSGDLQYKLISSTGERMGDIMKKTYPDTKVTDFYPEHKNGLSNEFRCYATFEGSFWKFSE